MSTVSAISIPAVATVPVAAGPAPAPGAFEQMLSSSIGELEQQRLHVQDAVHQFLSGENEDIHKVAFASQKAQLASQLFMQVRNKVISAYQEVMRMQM